MATHARFAFETAAGVRLPNHVMATQDAHLLFDTDKRAAFVEVVKDRQMSFLGILKKEVVIGLLPGSDRSDGYTLAPVLKKNCRLSQFNRAFLVC